MERYAKITRGLPREMLLLKGRGCSRRGCVFCDYWKDGAANFEGTIVENEAAFGSVTGEYGILEIVNSGTHLDYFPEQWKQITAVARWAGIHTAILETHWLDRHTLAETARRFAAFGCLVEWKVGIETFDDHFREDILKKQCGSIPLDELRALFRHLNLLAGCPGQTEASMKSDIETALAVADGQVCVNMLNTSSALMQPDMDVCRIFRERVAPVYEGNPRVDICVNNTDLGVGGDVYF